MGRPLRIVFAAPAYWPATAFGGPVPVLRSLAGELTALGHRVDVVTTTLTGIGERPARTSRTAEVDGATVHYLGTPLRFRWFGVRRRSAACSARCRGRTSCTSSATATR